jgi:hypothetical protein
VPRSKLIVVAAALLAALAGPAEAAPTLSTSDRLDDRRYVVAGERAYVVGSQAGRFPAAGWHIRGEMGGVWAPPRKLLDGLWFAIDGDWIGPATRFTSGFGHVAMDLPAPPGLQARRVELVPDGRRAALIGLRLRSTGPRRTVDVSVDAHSELIGAYPWGETTPTAGEANGQDAAAVEGGRLVFTDGEHAAFVGAARQPVGTATGPGFRGPQDPPVICPALGDAPERCDDSSIGKGAGGRLRYRLTVPAGGSRTLWVGVAADSADLAGALRDPEAALAAKVERRKRLAARTRVELPGDPLLAEGIEWAKQNLADSVQAAEDLQVRWVDEGDRYPPPAGTVERARFLGAGFPDYPWLFATDGEYTAFASVAAGQFEPIEDHLRALRDVTELVNPDTGKIVHEVVSDGTVYFGADADAGNTDETAKFPSAVALVWRWTGDDGLRDELYDLAVRGMHHLVEQLDADGDGWPEGLGNVEREGMGEEKLDNTVSTIRGLYDLADLARSKRDGATAVWAQSHADALRAAFEGAWWMPEVPQHADSLDDPGNAKVQQRHWIGVTPMEVELLAGGEPVPGLATREHGVAALQLRESDCYSGDFGLFHTGRAGCDGGPAGEGELQAFTLNTAVMAVGEGNYGRLGAEQQRRYTSANRRLQLPEPDEQPGAMPEIAPSPAYGRSIDRPFHDRAMVLQAWGTYGTLWPVVHQQLGVRPDLGRRRLEVTPQLPPYERRIAGRSIRLGDGSVDVVATRSSTTVHARLKLKRLTLGVTLPHAARVKRVLLDGRAVPGRLRETNRGLEVLARASSGGRHTLVVVPR